MESYAIYVRVSTDRDEQVSSVENQIDICRNWLERNGFTWEENRIDRVVFQHSALNMFKCMYSLNLVPKN
ncbi:hypothetical protein TU51_18140 [Bacillus cytotoxicus]|nr:hypothetical protein TU51_18140 [Bacillus cytotoxicus]